MGKALGKALGALLQPAFACLVLVLCCCGIRSGHLKEVIAIRRDKSIETRRGRGGKKTDFVANNLDTLAG